MAPKRILLLYISQVSGHRSAAMAVQEAIKSIKPEAEILSINAFNYTNPVTEKVINRIYMGVLNKAPQIWDYLYDNPRVVKRLEKIKNAVHKFNSPKLKKLFDKFQPDIVACTQAFPCGMVADYKKFYNSDVKLLAVLTDFVPHSYWVYDKVDYYIVPSREVADRLQAKGVPAQKIKPFGIPFDPKFNAPVDREAVLRKLNFKKDVPTLLIMGGGHGLGPIGTIIRSLEKVKSPLQEIVVTGINTKLHKRLQKEVKGYKKNIVITGFVDNINELMSICDILITKPGGITTAEALAKNIPMIIIKPIPGQEANNTAFLTGKKAAIEVDELEKINLTVEELLSHSEKLKSLAEAAAAISKPQAAMDIAKLILSENNA